jgi:hypothetical protein
MSVYTTAYARTHTRARSRVHSSVDTKVYMSEGTKICYNFYIAAYTEACARRDSKAGARAYARAAVLGQYAACLRVGLR